LVYPNFESICYPVFAKQGVIQAQTLGPKFLPCYTFFSLAFLAETNLSARPTAGWQPHH